MQANTYAIHFVHTCVVFRNAKYKGDALPSADSCLSYPTDHYTTVRDGSLSNCSVCLCICLSTYLTVCLSSYFHSLHLCICYSVKIYCMQTHLHKCEDSLLLNSTLFILKYGQCHTVDFSSPLLPIVSLLRHSCIYLRRRI